jgi:hypothetical protein
MKIDRIKQAKDRRPFRPFEIRMSDGAKVTVNHPDSLAWDEETRTAVCLSADGFDIIDVDLVTSLGWPRKRKGA